MQPLSFSHVVFGIFAALGLYTLGFAAPSGRLLVGAPSIERVVHDPSIRAGSSHVQHWYSVGGGYHGGK